MCSELVSRTGKCEENVQSNLQRTIYNIYNIHKQVYVVHVLNLILASYTLALSFAFYYFAILLFKTENFSSFKWLLSLDQYSQRFTK